MYELSIYTYYFEEYIDLINFPFEYDVRTRSFSPSGFNPEDISEESIDDYIDYSDSVEEGEYITDDNEYSDDCVLIE